MILTLALVLPAVAAAEQVEEGSCGLLLRSEAGLEPAPVVGQVIHIRVTGIVARATVTQIFTNPTDRQVEAVYVFPLPETAAVDTLRLTVGDRVIEGEIQPEEEAAATYRQAEEEGRKAVLLEQQRRNVFHASVTRIGPGETVEVEIGMQFDVDYDLGTFRLRFPTVVAPRYEPTVSPDTASPPAPLLQPPVAGEGDLNPTAFRVDVEAGFPVARVHSSHEIRVDRRGDRFSAELAAELAAADRDFLLEWTPEGGQAPRVASFVEERGGERYVLLMVVPPPPGAHSAVRLPREAIFVIDLSGSMQGSKLEQARQALLMGLGQLQGGDRFNVVWFASGAGALYPESRDVDSSTLSEGRGFVEAFDVRGGTEMAEPLRMALEDDEPASTRLRQVIFITDGQAGNEEELFGIIQRDLGRSRIFTVGIGAAPNSHFLRRAAKLGRGTFTFIDDLSGVAESMKALLRKLDAPVVRDLRVLWDDPSAEAWPERVGDLYLGEPLVVAARVHGESGVRVSGWLREKHLEVTLPLTSGRAAAGLGKLWASRKIDALEAERAGGADPEEIRTQIVDLGLRHHLVTDFTSLVSVDMMPTLPAEEAPESHLMPVHQVYQGAGGQQVEECIVVVTSESPLLDERKIATGTSVASVEIEKLPSARDPWAALRATPGTAADRVSAGNVAAPPTTLVAAGSTASENVWMVDGVVVSDAEPPSAATTSTSFDSVEDVEIVTGGGDVTRSRGGVSVNLLTRRGTNEWRGSARYVRADDFGSTPATEPRDRLVDGDEHGGAAGGPLARDRVWVWGSYSRRGGERAALDGDPGSARLAGGGVKVNARWTSATSLVARWNEGEARRRGVDAGPQRSPEASLDTAADAAAAAIDATYVLTSNFFLSGTASSRERDERSASPGTAPALWAADGALRGAGRGTDVRLEQRLGRADGKYFFFSGGDHELTFGAERRDVRRSEDGAWPGGQDVLHIAGAHFGAGDGFFRLGIPGRATSERTEDSLWFQDTWRWGRVVVNGGLRYDRQRGILASNDGGIDWATLVPRLSVTVALGGDEGTLLRASWGRFTQQLTHDLVARSDPAAAGEALFRFSDANGDGLRQSAEAAELVESVGWLLAHRTDPDLEPALDDELLLGVERTFYPDLAVSLFLTHRRQSDVHELRDLVIGESGELRAAVAGDYVLDHVAAGTLPDATAYSVPVYSLRPGVVDGGASLLVNGDRDLEYRGVTLGLRKRLTGRWMARAHVHYGRQQWRLGPGWAPHHDPTDLLGSGDDDGALYVEAPGDVDLGTSPWIQSTWSGSVSGLVQLFPHRRWAFDLAGTLHLRQGHPLPYYVWDLASADGLPRRLQVTDGVDTFRLDDVATFDLRLEKEISLVADLNATWTLDAQNVFDEDAALRRQLNLSGPRGGSLEETVASRVFRLGLRLTWN